MGESEGHSRVDPTQVLRKLIETRGSEEVQTPQKINVWKGTRKLLIKG